MASENQSLTCNELEMELLHSTYKIESNNTYHLIFARDKFGIKRLFRIFYPPYFYINATDWNRAEDIIQKNGLQKYVKAVSKDTPFKGITGNKLIKIYTHIPRQIAFVRDALESRKIKTYEADVLYYIRVLIDLGITCKFKVRSSYFSKVMDVSPDSIEPINVDMDYYFKPPNYKYAYVDIETYTTSLKSLEEKLGFVLCATFYLPYKNAYYVFYQNNVDIEISKDPYDLDAEYNFIRSSNELCLLRDIIKFLKNEELDKIISFSTFDIDYLFTRAKMLKIDLSDLTLVGNVYAKWDKIENEDGYVKYIKPINVKIPDIDIVDFSVTYVKLSGEPTFFNLDYIAKKELGIGKVKIPSVKTLWENKDYATLLTYNIRDVVILKKLEEKLHLLSMYAEPIRKIVGCNIEEALIASKVGDIMYLRHTNKLKVALYTKPTFPKNWEKPKYKGAVVFDPIGGRYQNVMVFDWSELYPSIIETFNIGYNTYRHGDAEIDLGSAKFTLSEPSWTVLIMKPLREYRKVIKQKEKNEPNADIKKSMKVLSSAIKAIINSLYGLYGYAGEIGKSPASRFYSPPIAESITVTGREIEKTAKDYLENVLGYMTLYGDTDSLFIKSKTDDPAKEAVELKDKITECIKSYIKEKWKINDPKIKLDVDKIAGSMLIFSGVKKRYQTADEIKGVTKNLAELTNKMQIEIGNLLLNGKDKEAVKYYKDCVKKFLTKQYPLDMIMPKAKCNKQNSKVKSLSIKSIESAKQLLGVDIEFSQRFYWVYITPQKCGNVLYRSVANLEPNLPDKIKSLIDIEKMCIYVIVRPMKKYLDLLGFDAVQIYIDVKKDVIGQSKLSNFI